MVHSVFTWASMGLGIAAAALWLGSALVRPPPRKSSSGFGGGGGSAQELIDQFQRHSRWSAAAAFATALAVLCQALAQF